MPTEELEPTPNGPQPSAKLLLPSVVALSEMVGADAGDLRPGFYVLRRCLGGGHTIARATNYGTPGKLFWESLRVPGEAGLPPNTEIAAGPFTIEDLLAASAKRATEDTEA